MTFLLDTNIASAHLRRPRGLLHRFVQYSGSMLISTISLAELYVWASQASNAAVRIHAIDRMLQFEVTPLPYDDESAQAFGRLRVEFRNRGIAVQPLDLLIASVAIAYDLTLVTHNTRHFANVPNLRLADWLAP